MEPRLIPSANTPCRSCECTATACLQSRTGSGYRVYSQEAIGRVRFIRRPQAAGFRLDEIKEIFQLRYAGRSPCNCVRDLLEQKVNQMERQLAELRRLGRRGIARLIRTTAGFVGSWHPHPGHPGGRLRKSAPGSPSTLLDAQGCAELLVT